MISSSVAVALFAALLLVGAVVAFFVGRKTAPLANAGELARASEDKARAQVAAAKALEIARNKVAAADLAAEKQREVDRAGTLADFLNRR